MRLGLGTGSVGGRVRVGLSREVLVRIRLGTRVRVRIRARDKVRGRVGPMLAIGALSHGATSRLRAPG